MSCAELIIGIIILIMGRPKLHNYEAIIESYKQGKTIVEVFKESGITERVIRSIITKCGYSIRKREPLDKELIIELYKEGKSMPEISKELGCSIGGVEDVLRRTETPRRTGAKRKNLIKKLGFIPTKEWAESIAQKYDTCADAARDLGLKYSTFIDILRRFHIPRKSWRGGPKGNSRKINIPVEEAIKLSKEGYRCVDIAKKFGVSPEVLSKRLTEAGYHVPKGNTRKYSKDAVFSRTPYYNKKLLYSMNITACEICGETRVLDLCHINPKRHGGLTIAENSLVLCPNHHRLFDSSRLSQEEYNKIKSKVEAVFKQPEKVA